MGNHRSAADEVVSALSEKCDVFLSYLLGSFHKDFWECALEEFEAKGFVKFILSL